MKVLITGITGLLGTALIEESAREAVIDGIYLGDYEMRDTPSVTYAACDVTDKNALMELFESKPIDCIIHTAGIANTDLCEKEPEAAHLSNVVGTRNVIDLARSKGAKIVYISTNAVFNGKAAPYSENDKPNPINRYGMLKLECERLVREDSGRHLIIRPILLYGLNNPNERKSFFSWSLEKLKNGEKMNIVNDVFENPLLSYQCAEFIWALIDKGMNGIYHIAGRDVLSRYEAVRIIAEFFSLDVSLVNPVPSGFFNGIAPRPKDTSYVTLKIEKELGVKPIGFREGISILKKRMEDGPCRE